MVGRLSYLRSLLFVIIPSVVYAQGTPSQVELNGFLIGQYKEVVTTSLGVPYQTQKDGNNGSIAEGHLLDRTLGAYMVFRYVPDKLNQIASIQITGRSGTRMHPFAGLRLGDTRAKVISVLGSATVVTSLNEPPVELHRYEGKNYSVEFDQEGKLFSILLSGLIGFPTKPPTGPSLVDLTRALEQKDIDGLITLLMPDVEIFRGDDVIRYGDAARSDLSNPRSKISEALYSAPGSLRDIFINEKPTGNLELRVYSERKPMGMVFKFPESKEISEIVFENFAGSWRVWEIAFKQKTTNR